MMKILSKSSSAALITILAFTFACKQNDEKNVAPNNKVSEKVLHQINALGFTNTGVIKTDGGYIVEGDIFLSEADLNSTPKQHNLVVGKSEQFRTSNVVSTNGNRNITIYAPTGYRGYSAAMLAGLDEAISRYNALGLDLTFSRTTSSWYADIKMTRLSTTDEQRGVLGSAGFPTNGNPYNEIKMSGVLESSYGLSTDGIATIIGHEMGHCIGFRHTDYFDRSISCGGSTANEGASDVGAINIPGTSKDADLADNGSWMLACTDGSDRPFTSGDRSALNWMYKDNF
ncbi:M57 family metalloprotease [uncultured Microscilla sp.]|uniref:M57 family metalloprotease n=1 Tax=uncultured Microscilla sp. TaxID=432653 RepID=UPI002607C5D4|nr:M57 family metalloprotease [uncultured Microscilla sp.]